MPASRTGVAHLPLHTGRAPAWLFSRMARLAREVVVHVVTEYGADEVLRRLSDPFWFQALGCVLGFDWHSSGVTTTVCGALKEGVKGLETQLGLYIAGGKGATSRKAPGEIAAACERLSRDPAPLVYASRTAAKVDNAAVQDGFQIYHHAFFFSATDRWAVVQQGMNERTAMARRYHWLSEELRTFVSEPHAAVCSTGTTATLNLVAAESAAVRVASAGLAREGPAVVLPALSACPSLFLPVRHQVVAAADIDPRRLHTVLLRTYDRAPRDFETLLGIEGVGAKTLRALALVSEVIYGAVASTRDPARFSFAHGGKDGTPYPVDRLAYERTIDVLHRAVERAGIDRSDKVRALKRLASFAERPGA